MLIKDLLINNVNERAKKGTIPYIEIGDIDITTKKYSLKNKESVQGAKYAYKNAILISTVRPTRGAITIVEEEKVAVSSAFAILNINEKMCNYKYLFYYLNKVDFYEYLGSNSKGATYPTCSKDDIYNYEIELPCLEKQNMVVQIFDNINKSISIRNVQLKKCENLIKSQFVEMFGDPIINEKDWNKCTNKILCSKIGSGATPKGGNSVYLNNGITFIRSMNVYDNYFEYKDLAFLNDKMANELNNVTIEENDILLNITGASVCRSCIVPKELLPARVNQHVSILRYKNCNPTFILHQIINDSFKESLYKISKTGGATREALTKFQLDNLELIVPPIDLQNRFATIVKQIDKQKFVCIKSTQIIGNLLIL